MSQPDIAGIQRPRTFRLLHAREERPSIREYGHRDGSAVLAALGGELPFHQEPRRGKRTVLRQPLCQRREINGVARRLSRRDLHGIAPAQRGRPAGASQTFEELKSTQAAAGAIVAQRAAGACR